MKILMVLENIFPQDERVEKEIASLLEQGHEIRIATYSFKQTDYQQVYGGYTIYRRKISRIIYKFGAAVLVLPFYFGFWRNYLRKIYKEWRFEAIHIHDLPLARLGSEYKSKHGILFVADQHEYYSNWIVQSAHYNKGIGKLVKALSKWERYEQKHLRQADLVCTVEEPLRELYIHERGIAPNRVIVVPNTPLKSIYGVAPRKHIDKHFNLFYCGGLDILRGLDTAIKALPMLKEKIPEIRLILTGRRNKHFDPGKLASELGVEELVKFHNWVDYRELPHEIDLGDICFFTPPVNREEIHNTIATKIYQYMARGKPVIVGSARYMKAFVERHQIGLSVDEQRPDEFADAVLKIYSDPDLREQFSSQARKTIASYYWENTVRGMLNFYSQLEGTITPP